MIPFGPKPHLLHRPSVDPTVIGGIGGRCWGFLRSSC